MSSDVRKGTEPIFYLFDGPPPTAIFSVEGDPEARLRSREQLDRVGFDPQL